MTSKMTTIYEDLSNDFTHQTQTYIRRPLVIFKARYLQLVYIYGSVITWPVLGPQFG